MGRTVEEIAGLAGLDEKTLRKYYSRELERAADMVEALLDEAIFEQAVVHGRVGAQRLLKEQLARGKAAVPIISSPSRRKPAPAAKPAAAPLGKKAQADADAISAHQGTTWADALKRPQ